MLGLPDDTRACLFDLDGVLTDTASVHAGAWKQMFDELRAADLGVAPEQAVVFEDALAGVAAGRPGRFGAVIGVDRLDHADALRAHGADVVVTDLAELLEESA